MRVHATSDGEGSGTPLQYSCLENPMDREAWKAAVHGVAKSRTRLSDFTFPFHFHPSKNTGVGCYFLLQGIFLTQGSNPGLLHCRQTLYHLSHQGRPRVVVGELYAVQAAFSPGGPLRPGRPGSPWKCLDPLLLLPSIFPSVRVFSNKSVLHIRWPEYWSFIRLFATP